MPEVMIRNIPVQFPFEPYDVQRAYMEKVIDCLQSGAHGMLESPTGTGKTLSLLCASLAWLNVKKAQNQAMRMTMEDNPFLDELKDSLNSVAGAEGNQPMSWGRFSPKIIYSSRTHSQLTQAISEMKRTSYAHMRMAVIGSRDQLCTHPDVSKEENTAIKTAMCQTLLANRACYLHRNVERRRDDPAFTEAGVMDIEDLIKVSAATRVCPYYMSRELKQAADIVFMPYNYLLDPRTRRQQDVDMNNSIVILDEGHNVEKICEDSASFSLCNTDVALCIGEVTEVMKIVSENPIMDFNDDSEKKRDFSEHDLMMLKEMLLKLEKAIDEIPLTQKTNTESSFPGEYIFELLNKANVSFDTYNLYATLVELIVQYLNALKSSQGAGPFQKTGGNLEKLANFFKTVYHFEKKTCQDHINSVKECYKVFVALEKPKPTYKKNSWNTTKDDTKPGGKVVNFWCFNPGYGMKGLLNLGVHSIIVTSGTLSPLPPLISELGIPINITLENKHVITRDQVFVSVVSCGPDNEPLNSSFQNRSNSSYLSSLGRTIVNFARIIPEGLLVFFPSYSVLNQCKESWEITGIWNQIFAAKEIFVEPQGKRDLKDVMNAYYSRIAQPGSKGACFLAVCRGKVSEGLDFADQNGRAVILTGLPYPPAFDPRVIMKKDYLDRNKKKVTGQSWYQLEATRAVNQAIGRVIRHRHDYGAVLFCDNRFAGPSIKQQMSAWLRPYIETPNQFGAVTRGLCQFFKNAKQQLPQPSKKDMSVAWGEASSEPAGPSRAVPASFDSTSKWFSNSKAPSEPQRHGNFNWSQSLSTPSSSMSSYSQQGCSSTQKKNNGSKSMFGALEETVQVIDFNSVALTTEDSPAVTLKDCTNQADTPVRAENEERPPDSKRRKLKVMGVKLDYEQNDSGYSSTSSLASAPPVLSRKERMLEYLKMVKRSLTHDQLQIFNAAVKEYSRHSNYPQLIATLSSVFSHPSLHTCLKGFVTFIKDSHKEQFASFCREKLNNTRL
ncbi:regulator of telomere elongation helicase 1 homolog [Thrips palmi]|uniref:Regulator of telomere elongation helicase 1 homolog n=1 Tax=Thrips palmi TaxID=161013 RepID=A0A6P8Z248_THRPL|nr:regulator of telomere elongation helicase 1 homolog [Thrips palmi]